MHSKVQEKIDQLKAEEEAKLKAIRLAEAKSNQLKQKRIAACIPQARVWVESNLFDLIAKADLRIDKEAKADTYNQAKHPKELHLSTYNMIPNDIPVESIVNVINEMEGLRVRSEYQAAMEARPSDDYAYSVGARYEYYVKW